MAEQLVIFGALEPKADALSSHSIRSKGKPAKPPSVAVSAIPIVPAAVRPCRIVKERPNVTWVLHDDLAG